MVCGVERIGAHAKGVLEVREATTGSSSSLIRECGNDSVAPPGLGSCEGGLSQGSPFTSFRVHPGLVSGVPSGNLVLRG